MPSHTGLDKWFKQDWVDIGSKKSNGYGHEKRRQSHEG